MAADVLEKNRPIKEVVKGISTYLPNDLLNSPAEKLFGMNKNKTKTRMNEYLTFFGHLRHE